MNNLILKTLGECENDYDLFLFDMWGVIIEGNGPYPGVVDKINKLSKSKRVLFVTNAPREREAIVHNLTNWKVEKITPERVFTSGDIALNYIKEHYLGKGIIPTIYHLGGDKNNQLLPNIAHRKTSNIEKADVLIISAHLDEGENINVFDDVLIKAAKNPNLCVICANPDTIIPNNGKKRYCAGYFAAIIESYGKQVLYTGKPRKEIYDHILLQYPNIKKSRILMVGDTFETDILGAKTSGIDSALVLTGNCMQWHWQYDKIDDKIAAICKQANNLNLFPNFILSII